jgi:hypothetical protein
MTATNVVPGYVSMRHVLLISLAASIWTPAGLAAQRLRHAADVGARVRVDIADRVVWSPFQPTEIARHVRGVISRVSPDSLYLNPADSVGDIAIARLLIRRIDVSLGPPSRIKSALEVGSSGASILAVLFYVARDNRNRPFGSSLRAAAIGAGVGFGIGGLIGFVVPYERWRPAWLPEP